MGRGKIEIKRIENTTNRQVTYSKRRNGLVKKASEISVLCDSKVSVVIFPNNGKMHAYHSPNTSVEDILERYQEISGKRLWDAKHENLSNEIDRMKKENDNMQAELRHLKGEDIAALSPRDLQQIEDTLDNGLRSVRDQEMEIFERHEKNVMRLEEDKIELTNYLWQHSHVQYKQENMDGDTEEMDTRSVCINTQGRDYHYLTPQQPKLQDRVM